MCSLIQADTRALRVSNLVLWIDRNGIIAIEKEGIQMGGPVIGEIFGHNRLRS